MNNIGAVVVSYNSEDVLKDCLNSLKDSGITDIVVVDNNSQDKSLEVAVKSGSKVIKQSSNRGFAAAVNIGVRELSNEFVFLFNPDAKLIDSSLDKAAQFMIDNKDVGVVGFLLCDSQGQPELKSFGEALTPWSFMLRRFMHNSVPDYSKEVGWVSGGAMLVRRKVFEKLKGLDDEFFLYWEDVDFCHRVRDSGFKVVLMPDIKVRHARGASLDNNRKKAKLYDISADRYFYKHYPKAIWLLHRQLKRFYRLFWRQAR